MDKSKGILKTVGLIALIAIVAPLAVNAIFIVAGVIIFGVDSIYNKIRWNRTVREVRKAGSANEQDGEYQD